MNVKTLLVVLAHPDDESFSIGGTLAKSVTKGDYVHLVVATRGEAGIPGKDAGETAIIREDELRRACAELGIQELSFLGFEDGRLAATYRDLALSRILSIMRRFKPDVVVTFGPDGISGHPDHLTVHHWTTEAFDLFQSESDYGQRLYYIAPSEATQQGCGVPPVEEAVGGPVAFIDVEPYLVQKVQAAQQHQSQHPPFPGKPEVEAQNLTCHEVFWLARPRLNANGHAPEDDLFATFSGSKPQQEYS